MQNSITKKSKINSSIVYLILLALPCLLFMLFNYQWNASYLSDHKLLSNFLVLITNSAGKPFFIITFCLFFLLYFFILLQKNHFKLIIKFLFAIICTMILSFMIKSGVKNFFQEPRPYTIWLQQSFDIKTTEFYQQTESKKNEIIERLNLDEYFTPMLKNHFSKETGYSFPSGHSLFAGICFFWLLLLIKNKRHIITLVAFTWVILIEISRILLGVHYPRDVLSSIVIAWLIVITTYSLLQKFLVLRD